MPNSLVVCFSYGKTDYGKSGHDTGKEERGFPALFSLKRIKQSKADKITGVDGRRDREEFFPGVGHGMASHKEKLTKNEKIFIDRRGVLLL